MKIAIFLFFLSSVGFYSFSQINLVPNPSFEDTVLCPNAGGQVYRAASWYVAEKTPDYFNSCCNYPQYNVPGNNFDYQNAASGNAYCGFYAYSTVDTNYREKIGVQLLNPLIIGTKYYVSFKLSATKGYLNGACNKIGVLFSTTQYSPPNPSPTSNFCQIWTDSINSDTLHWTKYSGTFIADSAYSYLTVGNFYTNSLTDTLSFWYINALQVYYFIDDICVSNDSIDCLEIDVRTPEINNKDFDLQIWPNPASHLISIKTNFNTLLILEVLTFEGKILLRKNISEEFSIWNEDISKYSNGIYFIRLISDKSNFQNKLIINH